MQLEAYVFDVGVQVAGVASRCSRRAVYDTHLHLAGLLKRLGASRVQVERSEV